jgi:hypothetical protein
LTGPGAVLLLPFPIGFFVWIRKRHKKVRRAIEGALTEIKRRESAPPAAVAEKDLDLAVAEKDLDLRVRMT